MFAGFFGRFAPELTAKPTMLKNYLSLIKFSHTIFAMPFAMVGFFLGTLYTNKSVDSLLLLKVVLCMVFARSAAMAFNRYLDRDIDLVNPRTRGREIPAGIIGANRALIFVLLNGAAFILTTFFINSLCFSLSPIALKALISRSPPRASLISGSNK